jgi:O-antigen/teichoic acid export membrane protein
VLKIKFKFALPKLSYLKEIFTFSFFILINLLVDQINWSVDKNLLGIFCGTIQVGIYTNSDQLSNYFFSFASTISDVFTPKVHRLVAENKPNVNQELTKLFVQVGRLQFMLLSLITIGFVTVGKPFVRFYADGQETVYYTVIILFLATFIAAIQYQGVSILQAKNMHKFKAILSFTVVILNIIISIPLCIAFGAIGSALGTFISNLFIKSYITEHNVYHNKKVKIE